MIFFFYTVSDESVNLPRAMRTPSEPATGNFLLVKQSTGESKQEIKPDGCTINNQEHRKSYVCKP